FIQAEDGIRDDLVTGVQTCALPISQFEHRTRGSARPADIEIHVLPLQIDREGIVKLNKRFPRIRRHRPEFISTLWSAAACRRFRSEERRVGKEYKSRWDRGACRKNR